MRAFIKRHFPLPFTGKALAVTFNLNVSELPGDTLTRGQIVFVGGRLYRVDAMCCSTTVGDRRFWLNLTDVHDSSIWREMRFPGTIKVVSGYREQFALALAFNRFARYWEKNWA